MESTRQSLIPGIAYTAVIINELVTRLEADTSIPWPERQAILKTLLIINNQLEKAVAKSHQPPV